MLLRTTFAHVALRAAIGECDVASDAFPARKHMRTLYGHRSVCPSRLSEEPEATLPRFRLLLPSGAEPGACPNQNE